jgi:hypothetical protein
MHVLESRTETFSFKELHQEGVQLRRKLKLILQELREADEERDHIIELRELLRIAPEILARGIRFGECPDWNEDELTRVGLTGEVFPLQYHETKQIFRFAYLGVKLRGDTIRLGQDTPQGSKLAYAGNVRGRWDELYYLLVPHFSRLIQYYRQMRLELK